MKRQYFKYILFSLGLIIWISSLLLFSSIITTLEEKAKNNFRFQIEVFEGFLQSSNTEDITFLFQNLVKNTVYPVIYTTADTLPLYHANLGFNEYQPTETELKDLIREFVQINTPIPVRFKDYILGYYCYGEPTELRQLRWLPYIITLLSLFLAWVAYYGYQIMRSNEINYLWVGMSKETAHQLGTPISSLFGWFELLKSDKNSLDVALPEVEKDLFRLKTVSQRFAQIGSKPRLVKMDLAELIRQAVDYFSVRSSVKISFTSQLQSVYIKGNEELLFWVFENLIRNAIDSVEHDRGEIRIHLFLEGECVSVQLTDNGKGIESTNKKHIFDPGFSTKKRGWGLGLSLAKRIINEYHKGELFIATSEVNKGTTMQIDLKYDA